MTYLTFRNKHTVPPGGWQYEDPDTGLTYGFKYSVSGRKNVQTVDDIVRALAEDRSIRDVPMLPENIEKLIVHYNCMKLDDATRAKECFGAKPTFNKAETRSVLPTEKRRQPFNLRVLFSGMQVFTTWVSAGMPLVSKEEANRRAAICVACPMQADVPGCRTCSRMARTIMRMQPKAKTQHDRRLKNCMICKCVNQAQVWAPEKYLSIGVTDDMMEQFPSECWKKQLLTPKKDDNENTED